MSTETIGQKINRVIESQGRSKKWMAEQLGLSPSSFSQRISGNIEFKYSEIESIMTILRVDEKMQPID